MTYTCGVSVDQKGLLLVLGGLHFIQVSAGNEHSSGVTTDHAVYCWGRNLFGSVGDGTTVDRYAPVRVLQ